MCLCCKTYLDFYAKTNGILNEFIFEIIIDTACKNGYNNVVTERCEFSFAMTHRLTN